MEFNDIDYGSTASQTADTYAESMKCTQYIISLIVQAHIARQKYKFSGVRRHKWASTVPYDTYSSSYCTRGRILGTEVPQRTPDAAVVLPHLVYVLL